MRSKPPRRVWVLTYDDPGGPCGYVAYTKQPRTSGHLAYVLERVTEVRRKAKRRKVKHAR